MKRINTPANTSGKFAQAPDERAIAEMLHAFQRSSDEGLATLKEIRELLTQLRDDGRRYSEEAEDKTTRIERAMQKMEDKNNGQPK